MIRLPRLVSTISAQGPTQGASRWSKYVDQTENEPECDDEEHEEEDAVYTDPEQCRQHNYIRLEQWLCCFFFPILSFFILSTIILPAGKTVCVFNSIHQKAKACFGEKKD